MHIHFSSDELFPNESKQQLQQDAKKSTMLGNSGVLCSEAKKNQQKTLHANQAKNAPEPPSSPLSLAH